MTTPCPPTAPADRPLSGITVFELGQNIAAPSATQVLGDLGARVIKIEKADGDDARRWGPPFWEGASAMFQSMNRNKESVTLRFRDADDLAALEQMMLAEADVVLQSMRPGLLAARGLTAQNMCAAKPSLVWCDLGAFGSGGPLSELPGYDPLMQAFAGLMSVTGEPDGAPVRTGYSVVDMGTGMWAAIAILSALFRRAATGLGCVVEVSLFETAMAWMSTGAAHYQAGGEVPGRHGSGAQAIVPYKAFKTADGYLVVAAANDALFQRFAAALGQPGLAADARFADNPSRVAHREPLYALIDAVMPQRSTVEWAALFSAAGIPCAPMQNIAQALAHPHTQAIGLIQAVPGSSMTMVGPPMRFDGKRPEIRSAPPALGQANGLLCAYRP